MCRAGSSGLTAAEPVCRDKQATGHGKMVSVRNGYGFINRKDTEGDVFVHQAAMKSSPRKCLYSIGDGEDGVCYCRGKRQYGSSKRDRP